MDRKNQSEPLGVDSLLEQSTISDNEIERRVAQLLKQDLFREKTKQIIGEYIDTVPFMKKVQEYADTQIDTRLFKNTKVVVGVIIGWIVTAAIAFAAARLSV